MRPAQWIVSPRASIATNSSIRRARVCSRLALWTRKYRAYRFWLDRVA